ncbi:MAG TPA: glycoside hydrolase family 43 protein [Candidatus Brocadiia bacterium]|nr:glycoside hydrolase family 43 protein [Candidatus Brocadiia bacterium]
MIKTAEIRIRDPFIVPDNGAYHMYGTKVQNCWSGPGQGFEVFTSADLENWEAPVMVFTPPKGFWADRNFWAPEVHRYRGRWHMFASFKSETACRGTQILVSDSLKGPFAPISDGPVTPRDWDCLDGTFFLDAEGNPWIVFCHEWTQIRDGGMCAMSLTPDLKAPAGEPITLFHASAAPWKRKDPDQKDFVTDGPFMHRCANGALLMLWSSFGDAGYAIGTARSATGKITGPWTQDPVPIFARDGGHGMVFKTFDGRLMLSIHAPNKSPDEKPFFVSLVEKDGRLTPAE